MNPGYQISIVSPIWKVDEDYAPSTDQKSETFNLPSDSWYTEFGIEKNQLIYDKHNFSL